MEAPAVDVVADWKAAQVVQANSGGDVPVGTVRLRYAHYEQTQRLADLNGSVSAADASDLGEEWRVATYSATPAPNPHKRLLVLERDTALTAKADADTEALRLQTLHGGVRRTHQCTDVFLNRDSLLALDLASVLELRWRRYGFSDEAGSLRRVLGMNLFFGDLRADLTLWGA
jgi:hypothetical protein